MGVTQYIGSRYVPLFADPAEWNSTRTYEPLTIVMHEGNSYTSKQYVPKGLDISNEDYWAKTGNYNAQVEQYRKEVKLVDALVNDSVIPAVNKNSENISAEITRAENEEKLLKANRVHTYNTAADMQKDENLEVGAICHTNGFYDSGDTGGAWYAVLDNQIANGMDILEIANTKLCAKLLVLNSEITPNMFGAYGDDSHDDNNCVMRAVSYALENKIVLKLTGMYAITEAIKITDTVTILGVVVDTCGFHKTTNTKSAITDEVDAIILVDGNTNSAGTTGKYSYRHRFERIRLQGCVEKYVADKTDSDKQYGFYSKNGIIKSTIRECNIKNVDVGIYSPEFWNSELRNCRNIHSFYTAVDLRQENQGAVIVGNNTTATHEYGFRMGALSYSDFSANLVEWVYDGVCYSFTSCTGDICNNGFELGNGCAVGFYFLNSKIDMNGCYMGAVLDNGVDIEARGSIVSIRNSTFGEFGRTAEKNYKLLESTDSIVKIENGKCYGNYGIKSSIKNTILEINGCIYDTLRQRNEFNTKSQTIYDDTLWNTGAFSSSQKLLRLGMTGYQDQYGTSREWANAIPKGSLTINDAVASSGVAGWLTNATNNVEYTSKGTITVESDSKITMSDYFIDDYGTRVFKNLPIIGNTSAATAVIDAIDKNGVIHLRNVTGNFVTGETIRTKSNSFIRNGDTVGIMAVLTGPSVLRPVSPEAGVMYYDRTLSKPIWYNGSNWIDATGNAV